MNPFLPFLLVKGASQIWQTAENFKYHQDFKKNTGRSIKYGTRDPFYNSLWKTASTGAMYRGYRRASNLSRTPK